MGTALYVPQTRRTLNSNAHHAALLLASRRMVTFAGTLHQPVALTQGVME